MRTICKKVNKNLKHSAYITLVERIYNEHNKPQRYKGTIESMLREFFSKTSKKKYTWKRSTFKDLLIHMHNQKGYAILRSYNYVQVLHNISSFGNKLVRPIEDWQSPNSNPDKQLSSLIKHCFAKYEVPVFIENTFYGMNSLHMLWYVQLGNGKSVKSLSGLPVHFTSRMAHIFRNVPDHFSVNKALRYTQAIGLGATKKSAEVIASSNLAEISPEHESFWITVVQFFVSVECISSEEIDHIVEYLAAKYHEEDSFSMKGRTFNALLNQANQWHRKKYFQNTNVLHWKASGIPPLYIEEEVNGSTIVYKTIELRNSFELYEEGEAMSHCVEEYDDSCLHGESAIFSLQREVSGQTSERLATVEIGLPGMYILQTRAKYNEDPCAKTTALIDHWINSSTVRKHTVTAPEQVYQPAAHRRMVEREQMRTQDIDYAWLVRLIFWILYLLFMYGRFI